MDSGGYSSSTVIGINTRKYHGLLIAPLTPPARRNLILSKVDESIVIENEKYDLYSNICKGFIAKGFEHQEEFEKEYFPTFTYQVQNVNVKKTICMEYRRNTVCIQYKVHNKGPEAKMSFTPIMNFRDFHCMTTDLDFSVRQELKDKKVKLEINEYSCTPIYMHISEGEYIEHHDDKFKKMFYMEEEKRGFFPEEDHTVPGRYEVTIPKNSKKEITFVCSLEENIEEIDVKRVISDETKRITKLIEESELTEEIFGTKEFLRDYMIAADDFVVYRPNFGLHTVLAGYPWFLDWGRDTLLSFEGLLLLTKRFEIAKEVIFTMIRDIKFGLVPNGYSGYDNRPLYNSADSSLLLFQAIYKYLEYTNDYDFIKENVYSKLVDIIESYKKGIDLDNNDIFLDKDYLISSGNQNTQNTWMDAKYAGIAITPRNGKAVEINAMWYNSLKILEELSIKFDEKANAKKYSELAKKCKKSFEEKFYSVKRKSLYDVIGDDKIRPNQLFALSLTYPVIETNSEMAAQIFETTTKKLLNKYGLKTLSKTDKGYVDIYEGDGFRRDSSYHQGITWPWLLGLYYDTLKNMIKFEKNKTKKKELETKLKAFIEDTKSTFEKAFYEDGCARINI
ncbi:MAG: glycogen debranching enzyme N-terminal domain-containing protein [Oscillospiraceae bacterium]|nr:glycogen debranching enzyme N-terminal domain-containing protein [Oscillospiraceae bacterium]